MKLDMQSRVRFAEQLNKNPLLPLLLDERRADILETWEVESDPAKREALWHESRATSDLKDFIYGKIREIIGNDESRTRRTHQ